MSSQWRPLQPEMSSNGSLSPLQFGRPVSRQITKNPQNIMQNYQQQPQSNGFNAFSYNQSPTGNGGSPSSAGMPTSASTSRLSSLMGNNSSAFDFGMETGFRSSGSGFSSGGGGGGGPRNNMPPMGMNHGNQGNNGFTGLFDRSMSGYENSQGRSNPGFDRQMSVPANLADQGKMNGYQQHRNSGPGGSGGPGGFNNSDNFFSGFGNRSSPPQQRSGFNDMKIGTWNEGGSSGNNAGMNGSSGNSGGGSGGGGNFPSVSTFEIGTFNISNSNNGSGSSSRHNGFNEHHPPGPGHRETGIIEKLLVRNS